MDAVGGKDLGMFFSDASSSTNEAGIMRAIQSTESGIGRRRRRRNRIMEDIVFKDSRREPLIQRADVVAYILQKHCYGDPSFSGWLGRLDACMWKRDGKVHGFGIKDYPDPR